MSCLRPHSYGGAQLGFEPTFSGLKCQPLSTALPSPLRTTQLLGDSKPVVTMGTELMWKAKESVSRQQWEGSRWAPQPLPAPATGRHRFQLWGLGFDGRSSVTRPGRGVMMAGNPGCCPCKPGALVECVTPGMGAHGPGQGASHSCFPQTGCNHTCSADSGAGLSPFSGIGGTGGR